MSRFAGLMCLVILAGCAGKPPAPIEDRSGTGSAPNGYHRVASGDTLYAIAFDHGLDYRQLARWNGLKAPYTIFPGQDLRLVAPSGSSSASRTARTSPPVQKPKPSASKTSSSTPASRPKPTPSPGTASSGAKDNVASSAASSTGTPGRWLWPVKGRIIRGFSPTDPSRDGIDIAGSEGDTIRASAAGTVVYSGNGLIGYGELIIVKHDDRWLSAYGHNRKRLVSEGETVRAGQKIAEMGRNDRNEQVLHFEIRSNGRPVNPLDQLPAR